MARQSSAKAPTAVRIRFRPQNKKSVIHLMDFFFGYQCASLHVRQTLWVEYLQSNYCFSESSERGIVLGKAKLFLNIVSHFESFLPFYCLKQHEYSFLKIDIILGILF